VALERRADPDVILQLAAACPEAAALHSLAGLRPIEIALRTRAPPAVLAAIGAADARAPSDAPGGRSREQLAELVARLTEALALVDAAGPAEAPAPREAAQRRAGQRPLSSYVPQPDAAGSSQHDEEDDDDL